MGPNEVVNDNRMIRYWRGRCIRMESFKKDTLLSEHGTGSDCAPLLEMECGDNDEHTIIKIAYFPLSQHA